MTQHLQGRRVACVHLYDDFSGSAKVFSHAIAVLKGGGAEVRVIVGSAGESGFVRAAHSTEPVFYRFSENQLLLLLWFLLAQALLFMSVIRSCLLWKADLVYANTVLTPGALLAGWLCRRRVVVHLHEVSRGSRMLFRILLALARLLSDRIICVSGFMPSALDLPEHRTDIVSNSLAPREWATARAIGAMNVGKPHTSFLVLMVSSLKWYKGLDSFLALAGRFHAESEKTSLPVCFRLLLNCSAVDWARFHARQSVSADLSVVLRPHDVYQHYGEASLVLNLSHRQACIETFGMTLLEAMACGVPVVSPTVGGCTELFEDGAGGWRIDSHDVDAIADLVRELAGNESRWAEASHAAYANAAKFDPDTFSSKLCAVILALLPQTAHGSRD